MKLAVTMKGVNSTMTNKATRDEAANRQKLTCHRPPKDRTKSRIPKQKPGFKKKGRR